MSDSHRPDQNQDIPPLSVVMITLNEELAIAKVVADIKNAVPQAEIVVVDSSSDRTAEIAGSMGCRIIRQLPPQGFGPALHAGLQAAKAEKVVTLDCDDTYPAEAIPMLLDKLDQGFDMVSASRLNGKPAAMPWTNYLANVVFARLAQCICGVKSTDVHTGMRVYRRSLLSSFKYDPHGMALPVELLIGPSVMGYKWTEIFIDYRPRLGQTTLRPLEGTIWTLRRIWKWRRFLQG